MFDGILVLESERSEESIDFKMMFFSVSFPLFSNFIFQVWENPAFFISFEKNIVDVTIA